MRWQLLPAFFLASGCGAHFRLPMTAGEMMRYDSTGSLVAYLGQPDASPAVCDLRAGGPHVRRFSPDTWAALIDALLDGKITPTLGRRCIDAAIPGMSREETASLFDAVIGAYSRALRDSDLEQSPAFAERVGTLERLYLERPIGSGGHPAVLGPIFQDLRTALAGHALDPVARSFAREMIASVDVEQGAWQGQPVDVAMLDRLATEGNEMTLLRFAQRLPRSDLREEAMRRIIRVHIALSRFDEVRAAQGTIEDIVLSEGRNRVLFDDDDVQRVWFDQHAATIRNVLVRQHVWEKTATLLGYAKARPTLSVLPELSFRASLWADLRGLSGAVTLCGPKGALDPTPCIDATDVTLDNPFTYLDTDGAFHFRDNILAGEVIPWAGRETFTLPVRLRGRPAVSMEWGLYFERSDDLDFGPPRGRSRGPDLEVQVDHPLERRYVFTVDGYAVVVEGTDLTRFHVVSRGGAGSAGSSGTAGFSGTSGSECSNGGPGGDGGPGGNGTDGGDGGDIHVLIACSAGPCDVARLERIFSSVGGDGGPGGSGGSGGLGGSGGPGRPQSTHTDASGNIVVDDPGCFAGSTGPSGASGRNGSAGSRGRPGRVAFSWAQ